MKYINLFLVLLLSNMLVAQNNENGVSFVSGIVSDQESQNSLENVLVELLNIIPIKSALTDAKGAFRLEGIPVGRHRLLVSKDGYEQTMVTDIVLSAGGSIELEIKLNEIFVDSELKKAVTKKKKIRQFTKTTKDKPNNTMAGISARPFTIEEASRYAGSRNDPARLVTNYAGASGYDDSRNDIVIRGNSPSGVQWLIEELPIENPNHISTIGTTGGITPILNTYALANSDFMTGAFAAQYGNTVAGVFDLSLRKGSTNKVGFMGVLGTQRIELLLEGPLSKQKKGGSFLVSVRGSLGNFLFKDLFPVDPEHQDVNFKMNFGKKRFGELEIFGIGGRSVLFIPYQDVSFLDEVRYDIFEDEEYNHQNWMGLLGVKYTNYLSKNTFWRTVVGATLHYNSVRWVYNEELASGEIDRETTYSIENRRLNYMVHSYVMSKLNKKLTLRGGFSGNYYDLSLYEYYDYEDQIDTDFKGGMGLMRAYIQAKYSPIQNLTFHLGLSSQYLSLNQNIVLEPRFSMNWEFFPGHTLSAGYGWHHQMQNYLAMFYTPVVGQNSFGEPIYSNENQKMKFTSSHHFVLEYNWVIAQNWRFKLQGYVQLLDQVPVEIDSSAHSDANIGATFYDVYTEELTNGGQVRNMGVNLTVEKFFARDYYGLLSGSYFTSNYTGSDGVWRRTVFNNTYIVNLLFGKEFKFGKRKRQAFFVDVRFSTMGGRPYTPIALEETLASFQSGDQEVINQEEETNTQSLKPFYQVDLKIGVRFNTKKSVHTIKVDFFNIANIKNPFAVRYSEAYDPFNANQQIQGQEEVIYQRGFIPDVTYIVQF
jgi:hypothetical protein